MFYLCIRLITEAYGMKINKKLKPSNQYDQLFGLETLQPFGECNRLLKSHQVS